MAEGEDVFHLELDVPGVMDNGEETFDSQLDKTYSFDKGVDRMSAFLRDGVNTINAPKRKATVKEIQVNT